MRSRVIEKTADLGEDVVTLADAREWLRVLDTEEDALITRLVRAGHAQAERLLNRAIREARYIQEENDLGAVDEILLLRPPVTLVEKVEEWDAATLEWTELAAADYVVRTTGESTVVVPSTTWTSSRVRVTFKAGHAADAPQEVQQAVLELVALQYEHRGDDAAGLTAWRERHAALRVWNL